MADIAGDPALHVSGEERIHPALQKLARAFIALQRWRQISADNGDGTQRPDNATPAASEASDGGA